MMETTALRTHGVNFSSVVIVVYVMMGAVTREFIPC
jgi:hypothetical protein